MHSLEVRNVGYNMAKRIIDREHFRLLAQINPKDEEKVEKRDKKEKKEEKREALDIIYENLCDKFGKDNFRKDSYKKGGGEENFPVLQRDGRIESSFICSQVLQKKIPFVQTKFIFSSIEVYKKAKNWLDKNRNKILELNSDKKGVSNG